MADPTPYRHVMRHAIEHALSNGVLAAIDPAGFSNGKYQNGGNHKAISLTTWVNKLAAFDLADIDVGASATAVPLIAAGSPPGPLHHATAFVVADVGARPIGDLNNIKAAYKKLLQVVKDGQKKDLLLFLKILYERKETSKNKIIEALAGSGYKHYNKNVFVNGDMLNRVDSHVRQLWAGVRSKNDELTIQEANKLYSTLLTDFFEYSTAGMGFLKDSITEAMKDFGFNFTGDDITGISDTGRRYLESTVGKGIDPSMTVRDPNAKRGREYMYAWWLFENEEDYQKVAQAQKYPRVRSKRDIEYLEPGDKHEEIDDLLQSTKTTGGVVGTFLGARDLVNRKQPITDVMRMPALKPGNVIALGATRIRLFDLARRKVRMGDWIHGFERKAGMSPLAVVLAWIKEGIIRFDTGDFEWHWTKWEGNLPVAMGHVEGRIVDYHVMQIPLAGNPLNQTTAPIIFGDGATANLGLQHPTEVVLFDESNNEISRSAIPGVQPDGKFALQVPIGVRFRIVSKAQGNYDEADNNGGYPHDPLVLTREASELKNIIIPKKLVNRILAGSVVPSIGPGGVNHASRKASPCADTFGGAGITPLFGGMNYAYNHLGALTFKIKVEPSNFPPGSSPHLTCFIVYAGVVPPGFGPNGALNPGNLAPFNPATFSQHPGGPGVPCVFYQQNAGAPNAFPLNNAGGAGMPNLLMTPQIPLLPSNTDQFVGAHFSIGPAPTPGVPPGGHYRLYTVIRKDGSNFTPQELAHIIAEDDPATLKQTVWDYNYVVMRVL